MRSLYVHVWRNGAPVLVGQIEPQGRDWPPSARSSRFRYARSWLEDEAAFPIDPVRLPLVSGWHSCEEGMQLHGVFHDAGPDGWGKLVLEQRYPEHRLGMLEFLAATADDRIGCLAFGPSPHSPPLTMSPSGEAILDDPFMPLSALAEAAALIDAGESLPERLAPFYQRGSSIGGARPKASFADDSGLWIAKFPMRDDAFDMARIEAACLDMAEAAGIETPERRIETVGGASVLLVRRFDRVAQDGVDHRLAFLSGHTALSESDPASYSTQASYADLAAAGRSIGALDTPEMFRRMLLNVFIGNTDDHLRNHGFLRGVEGGWRLSPIYDVVPHPRRRKTVLRLGRGYDVDIDDAFSSHAAFGLREEEALAIEADVALNATAWREFMAARSVSQSDLGKIAPAFAEADRWEGSGGTALARRDEGLGSP